MMKPERARAGNLCVSESRRCLRQPLVSRRIQFFSPPLALSNTRARTPRSSRRKLWPAGYLLVMLHQQLFDKHSSSPCANSLIYILPLRRANKGRDGIWNFIKSLSLATCWTAAWAEKLTHKPEIAFFSGKLH
jgi:hypothetical protein